MKFINIINSTGLYSIIPHWLVLFVRLINIINSTGLYSNITHWLVLFVRLINIINSTGFYSINTHWLVLFVIRLNFRFLNQSGRTNNDKTINRSSILVLQIKESMLSILTSWIIKNYLPMFLRNFRIKLPFVSYNYIN